MEEKIDPKIPNTTKSPAVVDSSSISQPKKKPCCNKVVWVGLGIVLFLAVGGLFLFFLQPREKPPEEIPQPSSVSVSPTSIVSEESNWKTYTNADFSIAFDYPSDWVINVPPGDDSGRSIGVLISPSTDQDKKTYGSSLQIGVTKLTTEGDYFLSPNNWERVKDGDYVISCLTRLSGRENKQLFLVFDSPKMLIHNSILKIGVESWALGATVNSEKCASSELNKILSEEKPKLYQILSTFRFVGTSGLSERKTFDHPSFTFNYPGDWIAPSDITANYLLLGSKNVSLGIYINSTFGRSCGNLISSQNITIDNIDTKVNLWRGIDCDTSVKSSYSISLDKNGNHYALEYIFDTVNDDKEITNFNQILSTFRFTE